MVGSFTQSWDLKYNSMSFADWLWLHRSGLKMILAVLDSTNMSIAYAHLTCTTHLWVHGLCMPCRACCEKQEKLLWLLELEYAKFSVQEKWNYCLHAYLIVSTKGTKHMRPLKNTPLGLTLGFHVGIIVSIIHSFHSFKSNQTSQPEDR